MKLLDLFCGVGGAAMGYHQAGFDEIVGVDNVPQPNYPFTFIQGDALTGLELSGDFDLVHASPPCQHFTVYKNNQKHVPQESPNLIPPTREMLQQSGLPYVIENVPSWMTTVLDPIQFCGTSFGIEVRRHRLFEVNWPLKEVPCDHGRFTERKYPGSSNRPNGRTVCNIGEWRVPLRIQKEAMETPWIQTMEEISQAIPPAFTRHIGKTFLAWNEAQAVLV